jgi:hypothetical protein
MIALSAYYSNFYIKFLINYIMLNNGIQNILIIERIDGKYLNGDLGSY